MGASRKARNVASIRPLERRRIMRRQLTLGAIAAAIGVAAIPGMALGATGDPPVADSGDTAWMLAATALVMIMLPGLALFYGGLARSKNVLSTIMQSFFGLALVSVVWIIVGFTLASRPDINGPGLH